MVVFLLIKLEVLHLRQIRRTVLRQKQSLYGRSLRVGSEARLCLVLSGGHEAVDQPDDESFDQGWSVGTSHVGVSFGQQDASCLLPIVHSDWFSGFSNQSRLEKDG